MNSVHNISKSKVLKFIVGTVLVCTIITLIIAANMIKNNAVVQGIELKMEQDGYIALSEASITQSLKKNIKTNFLKTRIKDLDLKMIEDNIQQDPWVQNAEVYINNKDFLNVHILQNVPVARIFTNNGTSYYIDSSRHMLPNTVVYPYPTPVFTGIPMLGNDELSQKIKASIAYLGHTIMSDTFWNAQFTQLVMKDDLTFEAATLMGDFKVILGDTTNLNAKLDDLFVFFKKGLSKIGWSRYQVIDASFNGQILANPAMGYVAPIIKDTMVDEPTERIAPMPVTTRTTTTPTVTKKIEKKTEATKTDTTPKPATNNTSKKIKKPENKKTENNKSEKTTPKSDRKPKYTLEKQN